MASDEHLPIVTDAEVLSEAHVPDRIPGRGAVLRDVSRVLGLSAAGHKPVHCWITGAPGTGKTAAAKWLLCKVHSEAGVKGLYINCWEYPTYFSVLDRIVRELRILGAERLTVSFKLERLQRHLDDRPLIIVLDEIDRPPPKERNSILYNLSQMGNVGLVCLCNSEHVHFGLEERVRSWLNPARLTFRDYSEDELVAILSNRALYGLSLGSWSEEHLRRIAQLSQGDARVAIQTLRNAALLAEKDGRERIQRQDVRAAWNSAKEIKRSYLLRKLTDHHRLLYELIAKKPGILSGDLWRLYLTTCRKKRIKPIAVRTYSDYCNNLADQGLVEVKRAATPGKVREFRVPG